MFVFSNEISNFIIIFRVEINEYKVTAHQRDKCKLACAPHSSCVGKEYHELT